jgi:hypothetical protein
MWFIPFNYKNYTKKCEQPNNVAISIRKVKNNV